MTKLEIATQILAGIMGSNNLSTEAFCGNLHDADLVGRAMSLAQLLLDTSKDDAYADTGQ